MFNDEIMNKSTVSTSTHYSVLLYFLISPCVTLFRFCCYISVACFVFVCIFFSYVAVLCFVRQIIMPNTACENPSTLFKFLSDQLLYANLSSVQRKYFNEAKGSMYSISSALLNSFLIQKVYFPYKTII